MPKFWPRLAGALDLVRVVLALVYFGLWLSQALQRVRPDRGLYIFGLAATLCTLPAILFLLLMIREHEDRAVFTGLCLVVGCGLVFTLVLQALLLTGVVASTTSTLPGLFADIATGLLGGIWIIGINWSALRNRIFSGAQAIIGFLNGILAFSGSVFLLYTLLPANLTTLRQLGGIGVWAALLLEIAVSAIWHVWLSVWLFRQRLVLA